MVALLPRRQRRLPVQRVVPDQLPGPRVPPQRLRVFAIVAPVVAGVPGRDLLGLGIGIARGLSVRVASSVSGTTILAIMRPEGAVMKVAASR